MNVFRFLIFILFISIWGCSNDNSFSTGDMTSGACVKEIDKNYTAGSVKPVLYRIDREDPKHADYYYVSVYYNKDWLSLNQKPYDYFTENSNFRYEKCKCPGFKSGKTLSDKVKKLDFSF